MLRRSSDSLLTLSDYEPTPSEQDQPYGQQFDVMDFSLGNSYAPLATDNNPTITHQTFPLSVPQSWATDPTSFGLLEDVTTSVYDGNVIPFRVGPILDGMNQVAASDALEMWSNIPWGFECVIPVCSQSHSLMIFLAGTIGCLTHLTWKE